MNARSTLRTGKGNEILLFPENYTVIDLETTGLSLEHDQIIEIGAIRVRKGSSAAEFQTLIHPSIQIGSRISALTGITNEMTEHAPELKTIAPRLRNFLGNDLLLGHSVDFDVTFLFDTFQASRLTPLSNHYIDTFPISQRVLPELPHHRLSDIASYYHIDCSGAHRAIEDCRMNHAVFESLKQTISRAYQSTDNFLKSWPSLPKHRKASQMPPLHGPFLWKHPLYQQHCVITGLLKNLTRWEAMRIIAGAGGYNEDKVNTSTNILILGKSSFSEPDIPSGKYKKALRLINEGHDIRVLSECQFLKLLSYKV